MIDVTDLYLPASDWGDNFDLVTAYGLPEIDLKAVILDITQTERKAWTRDPGFIEVEQLNYIFDRNVPFAVGPFEKMRSLDDKMLDDRIPIGISADPAIRAARYVLRLFAFQ